MKQIPVLLLTGYLGSGKTTLLNHILTNERGIRFAVIVNDIGEVNIDADLIQKGGIVGQDDDLVALQNGCICCTLKMGLVKQILELIAMKRFDYIVIEASGICEPAPIAQTICTIPQMVPNAPVQPKLDCIVTVVDALRMATEFGCGDNLTRSGIDEEDIENLVIEQIEFCNIILLNKISEVTPDQARQIRAIIRELQPKATIIDTDYANVDLDRIINTKLFDFEKVATSAKWVQEIEGHHNEDDDHDEDEHDHHEHHEHEHEHEHHHEHEHEHEHEHGHHHHHHHHDEGEAEEYGIGTFVYYRRKPFNFERFDDFIARHWPASVIRSKGVVWFSQNNDMSVLFEQAGVQHKITDAGYWYATAPAEELEILMQNEPGLAADWDPEVGDRMIKLVFIGRKMDRKAIEAALDACLD